MRVKKVGTQRDIDEFHVFHNKIKHLMIKGVTWSWELGKAGTQFQLGKAKLNVGQQWRQVTKELSQDRGWLLAIDGA